MNILYKNIIGNVPLELYSLTTSFIDGYNFFCTLDRISLCNVHLTDKAVIDLYIFRTLYNDILLPGAIDGQTTKTAIGTEKFYMIKNLSIPVGATLILEKEDIIIDYINYQIFIELNAVDSEVDVILYESADKLPIETFTNTKGYY
jgi:hypothetical protein